MKRYAQDVTQDENHDNFGGVSIIKESLLLNKLPNLVLLSKDKELQEQQNFNNSDFERRTTISFG